MRVERREGVLSVLEVVELQKEKKEVELAMSSVKSS